MFSLKRPKATTSESPTTLFKLTIKYNKNKTHLLLLKILMDFVEQSRDERVTRNRRDTCFRDQK